MEEDARPTGDDPTAPGSRATPGRVAAWVVAGVGVIVGWITRDRGAAGPTVAFFALSYLIAEAGFAWVPRIRAGGGAEEEPDEGPE